MNTNEKIELQNDIMKEGDELRKSLLSKLFNLNALLSGVFIVLFQLDITSFEIKFFNILPFCTVVLIIIYELYELKILGSIYYKLENWKKGDYNSIVNMHKSKFPIIFFAVGLTIIEVCYLFYVFLN